MVKSENFDFIKAWDNKDTMSILAQMDEWQFGKDCKLTENVVVCHFDSDLLIINNNTINPYELCRCFNIIYDKSLGANTLLNRDLVLNVSKVKEHMKDFNFVESWLND